MRTRDREFKWLFMIILLLSCVSLQAQDVVPTQIGYAPNTDTIAVPQGFYNLSTQNLHLEFPLYTLTQRDGRSITYKLTYDSYLYSPYYSNGIQVCCSIAQEAGATPEPTIQGSNAVGPGWQLLAVGGGGGVTNASSYYTCVYSDGSVYDGDDNDNVSAPIEQFTNWQFVDDSGTAHDFSAAYTANSSVLGAYASLCNGPDTWSGTSDDGQYYLVLTNYYDATVYDTHGDIVSSGEDTNGNIVSNSADELGRPLAVPNGYSLEGSPVDINLTSNGTTFFSTSYTWSDGTTYDDPIEELSAINLPDGRSYSFTYDSGTSPGHTGELTSMTLPTGGKVIFQWNQTPALSQMTTPDGMWTFGYGTVPDPAGPQWGPDVQTTVTDPNNNQSVYTVIGRGFGPQCPTTDECGPTYSSTQWSVYNGAATGTPLRTITKYLDTAARPAVVTTTEGGTSAQTLLNYVGSLDLVTRRRDYDYSGSMLREIDVDYETSPTYTNRNMLDLVSSVTTYGPGGNSSQPVAETVYSYDGTPLSTTSGYLGNSVSGATGHDSSFGSGQSIRGNLTGISEMVSLGTFIQTKTNYFNVLGDLVQTTDGNGNSTYYDYTDNWSSGSGSGVSGSTFAYQTSVKNALNQVSQMTYNGNDGSAHSSQDPNDLANSRAGTVYTYDALQRITNVAYPDGGNTGTSYGGSAIPQVVTTTVTASPNPPEVSTQTFDGVGRVVSQVTAGGAIIDTTYDALGRVASVTNPYYTVADATYGVTQYAYDPIGRIRFQTNPDQTVKQWSYNGNTTTATDERNVSWQSSVDALGRLIQTTEPGNLVTTYSYDPLGNLTGVTQNGTTGEAVRSRSFSYDAMSRLTQAFNPESGWVCYGTTGGAAANGSNCTSGYDASGNLLYKTDARGIVTSYSYDALNRLNYRRHSDGSQTEGFGYDGKGEDGTPVGQPSLNSIGRLSHISNEINAAATYSYDAMGRMTLKTECVPIDCSYDVSASAKYDLAGNMTDVTYPDGHHIQQTFDGAGRLNTSNLIDINGVSTPRSYVQSVSYNPDNSANVTTLGNGVQETIGENNRLQVQNLLVATPLMPFSNQPFLSHAYCYVSCTTGGTADNGNVWGVTDTLNSANTQGFAYDSLNRINQFALAGSLNQQYTIDSFGNMSLVSNGTAQTTFASNNRINNLPCASVATPYDAVGNQLCWSDQYGAVSQDVFDAESHITSMNTLGNTSPYESYVYDANGTRVQKSLATGASTEYVYFNGQPMAELDQNGNWTDYVYANGEKIVRIAPSGGSLHFGGTTGDSIECDFRLQPSVSYSVKQGDKLSWREYKLNAVGGIDVWFLHAGGIQWEANDTNGSPINQDHTTGQWQSRTLDLSPWAGDTILQYSLLHDVESVASTWDIWVGDMAITSQDGTVTPIVSASGAPPSAGAGCQGSSSNLVGEFQPQTSAPDPVDGLGTHYYTADHLGTTQMEFALGGWPVWAGQFSPFGQELDTGSTSMHYKFTGKERDSESGLDYFGARYYGSSMGRFMSADPSGAAFSAPDNPQSWNMYSYVQNSPLTSVDPDGLDCVYLNSDNSLNHVLSGDCASDTDSGYYFDGTVNTIYTTTGDASGQVVGIQGTSDETGDSLYDANPAGLSFAQPNGSSSTSGMNTTIDTWGDFSQTTQFNHGSHPFRDNNPGDMKMAGGFTGRHGAIGSDGPFGVFPTIGTGRRGLDLLLHTPKYMNMSVANAIAAFAPPKENNTVAYQQFVQNVLQVSPNAPVSSLSPSQFTALENGITRYEGFYKAGNYSITVTTNF